MSETNTVITDGIEMEYFRFGMGDRIFVILPGLSVQSVMGSTSAVEDAYSILKDDFTVYLFDRRKNIPDEYSISDMADDTAAVMRKLGLSGIYLFGVSQGGMIAMALTVRHSDLVRKLVLGSTSPHVKPDQQEVLSSWIELAKNKDAKGLYQRFGKEIYPPDVYEKFRDYFDDAAATVTDEELDRFVILAKSIVGYDVSRQLKEIECPVLALGVFEDPVLDSDATMEIAENLDSRPDFELYMYKGYGHAAFDTAPDYKQRVYDFCMKE